MLRDGGVTIDDPLAVFAAVLKNLPERVQVYPTENYFYFRFTQNGVVYVGNIRLAPPTATRARSISPTTNSRPIGMPIRKIVMRCWGQSRASRSRRARR